MVETDEDSCDKGEDDQDGFDAGDAGEKGGDGALCILYHYNVRSLTILRSLLHQSLNRCDQRRSSEFSHRHIEGFAGLIP